MSRSALVFPYGITLREGGNIDIFPAAKVSFRSREGEWLSLFLVIDSGATISALPKTDAPMLGVKVEEGIPATITGVGEEVIPGWRHELPARIGREVISLPLVFLNSNSSSRVLGRAGIFGHFTVVFEEHQRRSGFLGIKTKESHSLEKILDKIAKKQRE